MSLINDALKKAQKQRTGEAPSLGSMPSVGGQSASSISRSGKSSGNPLLVPAGIGAAVLVLAVGGWLAFGGKAETGRSAGRGDGEANLKPETSVASSSPSQSTQPAVAAAANPQVSGLKSQVSEPAATPATPAFVLQVAPKAETPPPKVAVPAPAATPQVSGLSPQVSEPAKPVLKLEPRAMTFIDNIKIAGVRASATDSKVLMNDRVYRIGDTVDHEMGLKLVGITNSSLTFEDEKGGRYTRNL